MATNLNFTPQQQSLIKAPLSKRIWLEGTAGSGKTTAVQERIRWILDNAKGYPHVLVFTATSDTRKSYNEIISKKGLCPEAISYNSFVQKSLNLFWPIVAKEAGFEKKTTPFFLDVDAEHIIMSKLIKDSIDKGYFSALSSPSSRVFNQIVIAMHKCAAGMIPFEKYSEIMKESWGGEKSHLLVFDQVQECGNKFRDLCLKNNMLDYSLQLECFNKYLLPTPVYRKWVRNQNIHFVFDNTEEEVPAAHHFVSEMADEFKSMLLVFDKGGGHRSFMGCDPCSADKLQYLCNKKFEFKENSFKSDEIVGLRRIIENPKLKNEELDALPGSIFSFETSRFHSEMIKKAAAEIANLVHVRGISPDDIVILSPTLSDMTYMEMNQALHDLGIKVYLNSPSRPLMSEKITRSLITLCSLIMPMPRVKVSLLDIVQMIQCFISGLDPMRGQLLVQKTFIKENDAEYDTYVIKPYAKNTQKLKERIPSYIAEHFELLLDWIEARRQKENDTPELLVYEFFNEILVRDGFESGEETSLGVCKILGSFHKFQEVLNYFEKNNISDELLPGWEDYFKTVGLKIIKAKYYEEIYAQPKNTVLVSLTSSYLSMNRHDKYQVWMDIADPTWRSCFFGELTNDAVLSRNWISGSIWDILTSEAYNDSHMIRQACALISRCDGELKAFASDIDEKGSPQRGKLLNVFSTLQRRFQPGRQLKEPINVVSSEKEDDILFSKADEEFYLSREDLF